MHELNVFQSCARAAESRAGLDVLGLAVGYHLAEHYLLFVVKKAGLDNNLKKCALGMDGVCDETDLLLDLVVLLVFHIAVIDYQNVNPLLQPLLKNISGDCLYTIGKNGTTLNII